MKNSSSPERSVSDLTSVTPAPTVGGVLTVRNAVEVGYPVIESLVSGLPLVDELVIVDGGSTDGTLNLLTQFADTYAPVTLFEREEQTPTSRHEIIDEQILFGIDILRTDWIFEFQADELWQPTRLEAVAEVLTAADAAGANSIRQWRSVGECKESMATVRFVRNLPDLGSWSGGDSFYRRSDSRQPFDGNTKHNVQPEYQTELFFAHDIRRRESDAHAARHARWLSQENDARRKIFDSREIDSEHGETLPGQGSDRVGEDPSSVSIKHPGTDPGASQLLFGPAECHRHGTPKSRLHPNLRRLDPSQVDPRVVTDLEGQQYRHGFHGSYEGGQMDIRNTDQEPIDTAIRPFDEPYNRAVVSTTTTDSVYFDPEAMEAITGLPYTDLAP